MENVIPKTTLPEAENRMGVIRETDFRRGIFFAWCDALHGKDVALYGTGANARYILQAEHESLSIAALVDDRAVGKQVCGMKAVCLEDALARGIDAIVIAAEFKSLSAVYRRIGPKCQSAGIRVFDMYGNDCLTINTAIDSLFSQSPEDQLKTVESCEVLFVNVALLIEGYSMRVVSDCMGVEGDVTRCLETLLSHLREQGVKIAFYCANPSLGSDVVNHLLEQAGLDGIGPVFLSSETGLFAENGLYRLMYEQLDAGFAVHMGPDEYYDCFIPLCYGKKAVLTGFDAIAPLEKDCCQAHDQTASGLQHENASIDMPASFGSSEERLHACVQENFSRFMEEVGGRSLDVVAVIAPLVIGFTTWLVSQLQQAEKAPAEILFAARDGLIAKRVYDLYCKQFPADSLPPSRYFYVSRKASMDGAVLPDARERSLAYFEMCNLMPGEMYAFVEFVGAGTCQRQLESFAPFDLTGFYFGSRVGDRLGRRIRVQMYFDENDTSFIDRYLKLEPFFSAEEPSLHGFTNAGTPVFEKEYRSTEELAMLHNVHEGVAKIAEEYYLHWHTKGEVVDHVFLNELVVDLDLCNTRDMQLVDDLSGQILLTR